MPKKPGDFTAQAPLAPYQRAILERISTRFGFSFAETLRRALEHYAIALGKLDDAERISAERDATIEALAELDEHEVAQSCAGEVAPSSVTARVRAEREREAE